MRPIPALLFVLVLAACSDEPPPAPVAQPVVAPQSVEHKFVLLTYSEGKDRLVEEARLNGYLRQGWRIVATETTYAQTGELSTGASEARQRMQDVTWTITVTLEREVK